MYEESKTYEEQHELAKIYIKKMIGDMGEDNFDEFYNQAEQIINRRTVTLDDIKKLKELSPKFMTYVMEMVRTEGEIKKNQNQAAKKREEKNEKTNE